VQARRGKRTFEFAAALPADKLRLGSKVLDFFKAVTALSTAIGIQRQSVHPSGTKSHTSPIVSAERQLSAKLPFPRSQMRDLGHPPDRAGFQCTAMSTDAEWFSHSKVSLPVVPPRAAKA